MNFSVPAFLFISGYFVAKKEISRNNYIKVTQSRLKRILIPYFFWSFLIILTSGIISGKICAKAVLFKLFTGGASTPYYFILLLSQFYILSHLLVRINTKKYGFGAVLFLNLFVLVAFYIARIVLYIDIPKFLYALPFYSWIFFYQYGLLLGMNSTIESKVIDSHVFFAILAILGLILSCIEAFLMLKYFKDINFATTTVKLSSFLYAFSVISFFLWIKTTIVNWPKCLLLVGDYSFGIYLIHIVFLKIIIVMLSQFKILYIHQPLFQGLAFLLTLIACIGIIYMSRLMFTRATSIKIFGL